MTALEKPRKIYLIRHGQTVGNGHHYVGWEDLPLNDTGYSQAQTIAETLKTVPITAIYSSALERAIKTAQPLSYDKKIDIKTDPRLNEIHYGAYQGRLKTDLNLKLRKDYLYQSLPVGESLHDVYLRIKHFWDDLMQQNKTIPEQLAIVGHYWSIRMLFGIFQNKTFDFIFNPKGYKPANGSIYEVELQWNEAGHINCLSHGYLYGVNSH